MNDPDDDFLAAQDAAFRGLSIGCLLFLLGVVVLGTLLAILLLFSSADLSFRI